VADVQTIHKRGTSTHGRAVWFFAIILLCPALTGIYLMSAPPESKAGSNYKTVELASIVGSPAEQTPPGNAMVSDAVQSLDGKMIAIEGEMLVPPGGHLAPNEFLLIDRSTNPSGSVKSPWQYVLVRMPADKKVQRIVAPMQMFGKFHAVTRHDASGRVTSIYELDADWMLVR
jgi:hypothetical protein